MQRCKTWVPRAGQSPNVVPTGSQFGMTIVLLAARHLDLVISHLYELRLKLQSASSTPDYAKAGIGHNRLATVWDPKVSPNPQPISFTQILYTKVAKS
eukprot:4265052-Amphidinium_carterae.1